MTDITLGIRLKADGSGLVGEVKLSRQELDKLGQSAKTAAAGADQLGNRSQALRDQFASMRTVLVALTAGALANFFRSSLDTMDALGETADRLGFNVRSLQEYQYALQLSGVSQSQFEVGLQQLSRKVAEAAEGNESAQQSFRRLGVELVDNEGRLRPTELLLGDIADGLAKIENPAERVGISMDLFGRAGARFAGALSQGSAELQKLRDQASAMGFVLDESLIQRANEASDKLDTMSKIIRAPLMTAMLDLSPVVLDIANGFSIAATKAGAFVEQFRDIQNRTQLAPLRDEMSKLLDQRAKIGERLQGGGRFFGMFKDSDQATYDVLTKRINDINDRMLQLQSGMNVPPPVGGTAPIDNTAATEANDKRLDSIRQMVTAAETEAAKIGMTNSQLALYQLNQLDAGEADKARVVAALDFVAAQEAATAADKAASEQGAAIAKEATDRLQTMRDESLRMFEQTRTPQEQFNQRMADLNRLLQERERFGDGFGVDDDTYNRGALQALDMLQQADDQQKSWIDSQKNVAQQFSSLWISTFDNFTRGVGQATAQAIWHAEDLSDAMDGVLNAVGQQVLATLIQIGVQQATLWALQKVGLISTTAVSVGAAATTAVAWAPAAAAVSLATMGGNAVMASAGISSTYALTNGLALAGMAHDGLDFIPREGTYLLDKGERVVKKEDNMLLTRALRDNSIGGKAGGGVVIQQSFSFTAADASGMDRVIQRYMPAIRAQAISAVQEAFNSRGKRGPLG